MLATIFRSWGIEVTMYTRFPVCSWRFESPLDPAGSSCSHSVGRNTVGQIG
jgi:hypothetical protein